jgi:Domain of unknown function (DUF932)
LARGSTSPAVGLGRERQFLSFSLLVRLSIFLHYNKNKCCAEAQRVRTQTRQGFQKHLIRFARVENLNAWAKNEVRPEIVLLNSHDKSSAYQLHCGLLRMVCLNGMVVADATF